MKIVRSKARDEKLECVLCLSWAPVYLPAATTHARAACLAAVTVIEPLRGITFSSFVVQRRRLDLVAPKVQSRGEAKTNEKSETNCISNEH